MQFKKLIIVLFLVAFFFKTNAQKFDLGKVSIAELEEKFHPLDSSAVAAIVYNRARTFFKYSTKDGFSINTEYEIRIKIYKKEGLKWANHQVNYYVGYEKYNDDRVTFSEEITYNLENGSIVKTKLKKEGRFDKKINKYWNEASITMPNVKVGSVIEYKYILQSENIVKFPRFDFQYEIPVNYSEFKTEIPGFFVYKTIVAGLLQVNNESKIVTGSMNYAKEYDPLRSNSVSFQQVNSKSILYNIPALKEEPFVDNIENYRSAILQELEKTQFYEEPVKDYSVTWEGVAKTIFENKDFGKELDERLYLVQDLKTILKNDQKLELSQPEKLAAIFKFVQQKMNWDGNFGYFTDKGVIKAYIDQTGNVAEINFILIDMLKLAGINANPVLLSTQSNGIAMFPSRTAFNYVIVAAEIDGKQILLDATNKYTMANVLPLNTLNWTGRLIKKDGSSEEINLVPKFPSKNAINMKVAVDGNGKIEGKFRIQKTEYEALIFRQKYAGINKENYLEKLENELNEIKISDYKIENINDFTQPIIESFTFATDNHCEIIGGKMYINPMLFFAQTQNPFVQEKRQFPIYFGYPKQEKFNISIEIPQGYVVESMPKPIKISTGENAGSFTFNIQAEGNIIQIAIFKEMNSSMVSAGFYEVMKNYYQKMIEKQNEKIILKRI